MYVGTSFGWSYGPLNGHAVYALNSSTGGLVWKYALDTWEVRSALVIAGDGTIYFVGENRPLVKHRLYAINPDGSLKWAYEMGPSGLPLGMLVPALATDGTIYVERANPVTSNGEVLAINPDGTLKWRTGETFTFAGYTSPAIGSDGTIYLANYGNLNAINPADGSTRWSTPLPFPANRVAWVVPSPSIDSAGNIYVATDAGILYAVSATGAALWNYDAVSGTETRRLRSSPAIAPDGTIYFGSKVDVGIQVRIYALKPDGTLKWIFEPTDLKAGSALNDYDCYSSPTIGADGTIYIGCENRYLYALNPDGTVQWKYHTNHDITWQSPVIKRDGTIFIGDMGFTGVDTLGGDFYAIKSNSLGLSVGSPWPRFHHDNKNSGKF